MRLIKLIKNKKINKAENKKEFEKEFSNGRGVKDEQ